MNEKFQSKSYQIVQENRPLSLNLYIFGSLQLFSIDHLIRGEFYEIGTHISILNIFGSLKWNRIKSILFGSRAKRRSYLKCMIYILECLACIFVAGVLVRRNLFDGIWSPENHPIRINNVPKTFFELYLASACLMVLFWYLFFHCWFNAWAEALRFGDRYFYGPWWLIKFENKIHRHWNPLVHQWLKCYIYSPIRKVGNI